MEYEILSESHTHKIIALSETEIGKVDGAKNFIWINQATGQPEPLLNFVLDVDNEIKRMKFANSINGLLVKFIRKDKFNNQEDMIVMERLYPIPHDSFSLQERTIFFEKFNNEILELHRNRFLHGDIRHPIRAEPEMLFNNIILTQTGLRLVDTGFSFIRETEDDDNNFRSLSYTERQEVLSFKSYFLRSIEK